MKMFVSAMVLASATLPCAAADPVNERLERLLNESEDLRQARLEMQRFWLNNLPAVLTYERVHNRR